MKTGLLVTCAMLTMESLSLKAQSLSPSSFQSKFSSTLPSLDNQVHAMQNFFRDGASTIRAQTSQGVREMKENGKSDREIAEAYLAGSSWDQSLSAWQKIYSDRLNMNIQIGNGDENLDDEAYLPAEYAMSMLAGFTRQSSRSIERIPDRQLGKLTKKTEIRLVQDIESNDSALTRKGIASEFTNPVVYSSDRSEESAAQLNKMFQHLGINAQVSPNGKIDLDYDFSSYKPAVSFQVKFDNGMSFNVSPGQGMPSFEYQNAKIQSISVLSSGKELFSIQDPEAADISGFMQGKLKASGTLKDGQFFQSIQDPIVLRNPRQVRVTVGQETLLLNSVSELTDEQLEKASRIEISHHALSELVNRISNGKANSMTDSSAQGALKHILSTGGCEISLAPTSQVQDILNPYSLERCETL